MYLRKGRKTNRWTMRVVVMVFLLMFVALAGPLLAITKGPTPQAGDLMLVIAPDAPDVVLRAGGRLIGPTQAPMAVLAIGDVGLAARLYGSGAWVVADGQWVAELCGVKAA